MPFYEYECDACGGRHEALEKVSDEPLRLCPACGESALKRLISAPSFRLKGGGWYETDFKSGNKRHLADSGEAKPAESKTESKVEAKTESKAESKSAPKPAGPEA